MQSIREMHRDNERRYHESQFIRDDIRHYADRLVTVIPQKKIGSRRRCVINAHLTLQTCRPRQVAASALADIFIVIIFPPVFHAKLIKIAPAAFWIIYEIRDGNTMSKH